MTLVEWVTDLTVLLPSRLFPVSHDGNGGPKVATTIQGSAPVNENIANRPRGDKSDLRKLPPSLLHPNRDTFSLDRHPLRAQHVSHIRGNNQ